MVRITWLRAEERLEHELRQLSEEGVAAEVLDDFARAWADDLAAAAGDPDEVRRRALAALDRAAGLSAQRPSDVLPATVAEALAAEDAAATFDDATLGDRLLGAWSGRMAGCLLGKPVEKVPREGIRAILQSIDEWPLRRYFTAEGVPADVAERWPWNRASRPTSLREHIVEMPEDDDLNYTMLALHVLETYGDAFTTDDVATVWLQTMPPLTVFTAERVVFENLLASVEPPRTARVHNPYREWIGAQIRGDLWGYVRPGAPAAAAELAWRDARLSHVENGVYAELFAAALVSLAFVEAEPARLVRRAAALLPDDARLTRAVVWAVAVAEHEDEWEDVLDALHERFGRYHWVHAVNNAALVAAALVHGGGGFEASATRVVMGGWDTDSNGATVGSVAGAMHGRAGVPDAWIAPTGGVLRTSLKGFDHARVEDLARRTLALVPARFRASSPS